MHGFVICFVDIATPATPSPASARMTGLLPQPLAQLLLPPLLLTPLTRIRDALAGSHIISHSTIQSIDLKAQLDQESAALYVTRPRG